MLLKALPLTFVLAGLALYTTLAGADFGAGFWQLFAGRGERANQIRAHAHRSMGPVWEANHVWLIFVLTVFWTSYPRAFGSIASTLPVPLFIAALGIILRGAAYALRAGASGPRESGVIDTIFSVSSVLTPFALGAAIGAIATGRVPVGNASGHLFSSWLNPTSIFVGAVAVANCAYLAAVYLAADAARLGERPLEQAFRRRALGAGVVAGAAALGGIVVVNSDYHRLFHALLTGDALAAVVVSFLAGVTTLALVWRRRFDAARFGAAVAVASIIAGWALARWPTILPGLTINNGASGHDTLVWIVVAVAVGAGFTFPSLGLLFGLTLTGRFEGDERPAFGGIARRATFGPRWATRAAVSCFIAGIGLLTFADAAWAHAIGVVCLLGFVLAAFSAIVPAALAGQAENVRADASGRFFPSRFRHPGGEGSSGLR
ncbi:MAG TPA: cytochrome d ubiquinol oxidase subunit II [Solirubrobacteraceae bacterium]|jgi:cytochrome d ubiquinol oxidase subunit II|nr:cytochrome d ubiquinol oxidase subunit II [Solirubrobacteraceae bacterium]